MMDFSWLNQLIDDLPKKSVLRKNLIDIAGYPSWENVNSNLLAFYFDKEEEHGFGSLFIDSLLDLVDVELSPSFGQTEFQVAREVRTRKGKRIDIVISQYSEEETQEEESKSIPSWALIIENKVNHSLNNDLSDYWSSTIAEERLGIVLSKYDSDFNEKEQTKLQGKKIEYRHVSHRDLINKVQEKMHQCFLDSDDRHLLYLKEFIANTNNYYNSENMNKDNEIILKQFHENKKNIQAFKKQDRELLKFVSKVVFDNMEANLFTPNSTSVTKGKHCYPKPNCVLDEKVFRFYVDIDSLRYSNMFTAYLELYDKKNTKYGSKLKSALTELKVFTDYIKPGTGGNDKATYHHIYELRIPLEDFDENQNYKQAFENALNEHFWLHQNAFLKTIQNELNKIIVAS
ncbi:MAG: PD-(D/E)XK nuclease family protein [Flavobacteriales bacterium]|jgi:hypothetical protein|nr:PD-(D/E)XK nuclease family protein [Flavobacteriales bacterium]